MALTKTSKWIGTVSTILVLGLGTSIVAVRERIVDIWNVPPRIDALEISDSINTSKIHFNDHRFEMGWVFDKSLIDNLDSTVLYEVVDDFGNAYEVDVRWTGDGYAFAFVDRPVYIPMPLYTNDVGRLYIVLDTEFGERQDYYLYKKDD